MAIVRRKESDHLLHLEASTYKKLELDHKPSQFNFELQPELNAWQMILMVVVIYFHGSKT